MRDAMRRQTTSPRPPRGFTLTELLVVIAIIGILVAFILVAAQDGIRRAQEKATQSLIAKLEAGVAERIEAILLRRADTSLGHHALASVLNPSFAVNADPIATALNSYFGGTTYSNSIVSPQRAQVIAQFDLVRAELPDVFYVQTKSSPTYGALYPLNFAGVDFPVGSGNFLIPLGAFSAVGGAPGTPTTVTPVGIIAAPGDPNKAVGIFGATFQAAAGIYKNLGYLPQGYDGADNSVPPNGLIDELSEGIGGDPLVSDPDTPQGPQIHLSALIGRRLVAHKHNTARSEMLYALLVEGVGPMGSTFSRDEFSDRQVKDTDGDGLPEFIDAWGQPLQFFRWPIYYNNLSSTSLTPGAIGYVQKGTDLYNGPSEPRQVDPLDPNQTLTSLVWWADPPNGGSGPNAPSTNATTFMSFFHTLLDPNAGTAGLPAGSLWDRGGAYARRSYYSRFLILSGGPDQTPGINSLVDATAIPPIPPIVAISNGTFTSGNNDVQSLIQGENPASAAGAQVNGGDDITNQGLAAPGGGVR